MQKNQQTTLDQLTEGDRYYNTGDKKKAVFQVKKVDTDRYGIVTSTTVCPGNDTESIYAERIKKKPEEISVVFLRNAADEK